MAGKFSNYLNTALLGHVFGNVLFAKPPSLYIGLMTTAGSGSSSGMEIVGNGYARQPLTFEMEADPMGTIDNAALIQFPTASGLGWGIVTDYAIFDAPAGGNMLLYGTMNQSKTVNSGDRIELPRAALTVSLR